MVTDHEMRMEALRLSEENDRLRDELKQWRARMMSVVHTVGGTVEGHPTSEINILQRLRQMVDAENERTATNSAKVNKPNPAQARTS